MSRPLRVILNDRPLCRTLTGVGNYIAQLLVHAPSDAPDVEIRPFYFTYLTRRDWRERPAPDPQPAATGGVRQPADMGDSRYPWWMRRALQGGYRTLFRALARGYALYHEPNHIPMRCNLPTVTTIHDLSVLVHPAWHPADRVKWYEREFDAGLRQTRVFIAASEFTRREMTARLGVPPERIVVSYQAPRPAFRPLAPAEAAARLAALSVPARFFLYVGTLEPRKNVTGLLEAYAALPPATRRDHPLLIAGAWGWKGRQLREALLRHGLGQDVRLLGYLFDDQLAALYSRCTALVWPTLYEGFGLPPLEALACGARVIVSNVASLPEVVGDAGVLLDPLDVSAWTEAMREAADAGDGGGGADDGGAGAGDGGAGAGDGAADAGDGGADEGKGGAGAQYPGARPAGGQRALDQAALFTWRDFIRTTVSAYRLALDSPGSGAGM